MKIGAIFQTCPWLIAALALVAAAGAARPPARHAADAPAAGTTVPVGSVVAFAGTTIPSGWLLCDGRALFQRDYRGLWSAIRTAHGDGRDRQGNKVADFNLPDYRGLFLRGVDLDSGGQSSGKDPDRDVRAAPNFGQGNHGNMVGSLQPDAIINHSHGYTGIHTDPNNPFHTSDPAAKLQVDAPGNRYETWGPGLTAGPVRDPDNGPALTASSETRPKNSAVYWIIRAR